MESSRRDERSRWVLQSIIVRMSVFQEQINMSHCVNYDAITYLFNI